MADYFDPSYIPSGDSDTRAYLIYLKSDGSGLRFYHGRDDQLSYQVNRAVYDNNRNIIGYGDPIMKTDYFTQIFSTTYPGPDGEGYIAIDPVQQRALIQTNPHNLFVDSDGSVKYKTSFPDLSKLSITANNIDTTSCSGLPGHTLVELYGLSEAKYQTAYSEDGKFSLASPITGNVTVRFSHPGYIQREYDLAFV
ncbi:MAG: hypothetical protein EOO77_13520 [Oxalobacteraceae bacterium]|nr:MAG: hypothetical protein EOO77_13520 [Oxalobacteraceae bacterium]